MSASRPAAGARRLAATPAVQLAGIEMTFNPGRPNAGRTPSPTSTSSIQPGEFVSLIGPSGCGKSTLLRLIADLIEPTAGTVTVNGKPARQARLDQDYGMAFQQAGLFEWRTVARNIELPLELQGWAEGQAAGAGDGDARAGQAGRLRRPPAVGAVGRHAAARGHRPRPRRRRRRCC